MGNSRSLPASGLMAFALSRLEFAQIAARLADRILKGAKPADMGIDEPRSFHLIVNLATARSLGLTVPPSVPLRSDKVIE